MPPPIDQKNALARQHRPTRQSRLRPNRLAQHEGECHKGRDHPKRKRRPASLAGFRAAETPQRVRRPFEIPIGRLGELGNDRFGPGEKSRQPCGSAAKQCHRCARRLRACRQVRDSARARSAPPVRRSPTCRSWDRACGRRLRPPPSSSARARVPAGSACRTAPYSRTAASATWPWKSDRHCASGSARRWRAAIARNPRPDGTSGHSRSRNGLPRPAGNHRR